MIIGDLAIGRAAIDGAALVVAGAVAMSIFAPETAEG
jgi:hypothetical protein